ncbi:MAG TPA: TetR family transcriptional regulator C-terminal domain-containing protein [Spirochaetota bacterium]|nr:TetR family transcriptional regulator C-terminal domain-containing protein [Spirochaetota bacterium]
MALQTPKGQQTREHVLESAMSLIRRKGYGNVSINDIIDATGVKKGNLYFHFPGKDDLILAIIDRARRDYGAYLASRIRGATALERIDSLLAAVFEYHRRSRFVGGCIFGNMALEMADADRRFADAIRAVFAEWTDSLERLLDEARRGGELATTLSTRTLAKHIVAALEGAVMIAKVSKSARDFNDCLLPVRVLLGIESEVRQ